MRPSYFISFCALYLVLYTIGSAQVSLTSINSPYHQDFDSLLSSGTTNDINTLPHGWTFVEAGTNGNTTYAASTGSANAGNTYSFGVTLERAFGGLQSGTLIPITGATFVNNTGTTITSLIVTYRGEQWRLGATGRADRIDFQYSLNATALNSGTWIDIDALDFQSQTINGTVGALNGNDTLNNDILADTITGLNIEQGSRFAIRWTDFNAAGADDGLAVDDFEMIPVGLDPHLPAISFVPAALNFGEVNVNTSSTLQYTVVGANLTDSIEVHTYSPRYSISRDDTTFQSSLRLPANGGIIFVRFSPIMNGFIGDSITHVSGEIHRTLIASGSGFDQVANIIPIAEARLKTVGTRVTVAGRVTAANEFANPAFIEDITGGVPVFEFSFANSTAIGDSVIVTGPIGLFNDQKQISGSGIFYTIVSPGNVSPKTIRLDEVALHEGELVTIRNVSLVNDDFVFYPQSTERITNDTISVDLRIDGDTNIPGLSKPQGLFDVTGVVGRFRTNVQLMPRFQEDIPAATPPGAPSDSIPTSVTLDIVNWNLEFFGARSEDYGNEEFGPADESLQLANVRTILDSLNADIVAVQEVSDDSLFFQLVSSLGHYKGVCSPRFSYSFQGPDDEFPPQKVCFIYDTTTVSHVEARVMFEGLYDSVRLIDASLLPGYPGGNASSFYSSGRLPYLFNATVTINGVETQISLIDVHAKSGAAPDDHARRAYDTQVLKDSLDAHYGGRKFIFLGDLNDDLDQSIATGLPSPYAAYVNDTIQYFAVTKILSDIGGRSTVSFGDVIDHQILSDEIREEYLDGSAAIIAPFRMIPNYANTTSDHLPVITRYQLHAPVVSFAQGNFILSEDGSPTQIEVLLNKPLSHDLLVPIQISGSADYGLDFSTTPSADSAALVLYIPAGQVSASFTLHLLNDAIDEVDETIVFSIASSAVVAVGNNAQTTITLLDNDIPSISFEKVLYFGQEGDGDQRIKLKLSTPVATQQQLTLQVFNGPGTNYSSDYTTTPAAVDGEIALVVPAGSQEVALIFTPLSDNKRELPELVSVYIDDRSEGITIGIPRLAIFTILDSRRKQLQFSFFPNPATTTSRLECPQIGDSEKIYAELRTGYGEIIFSGTGTLQQINNRMDAIITSSRPGIYILKAVHHDETYTVRLSKQ